MPVAAMVKQLRRQKKSSSLYTVFVPEFYWKLPTTTNFVRKRNKIPIIPMWKKSLSYEQKTRYMKMSTARCSAGGKQD